MKSKIESATSAFGILLTALVAIAIDIVGGGGNKASTSAPAAEEEESETPAEKKARIAAEKKAEADAKKAKEEADLLGGEEEEEEEEEKVTIEQLRAAGQAAIKAGKSDKMKAVLKKHGAENLGGLDESDYPAALAALVKLA